jgi:hypothetical protein
MAVSLISKRLLKVQARNSGRVPSRHKQGSEFQRWAAVNAGFGSEGWLFSPVRGCGLPGQNRVTPGGGAE